MPASALGFFLLAGMSMAAVMMKGQIACSYNRYSPPEPRIRRTSTLGFFSRKDYQGLIVLAAGGNKSKRRAGYVLSPQTQSTALQIAPELLYAYEDEYGGAVVDAESLPSSADMFSACLKSSLAMWKIKEKRGIWLKLREKQADLVPVAIKEGFTYHHAEPGYVMLTYWIPKEPCMLPATGSHQVGVGAFVMNQNREVLVVKEKCCPLRCSGLWKLPTGFVDKAEEIFQGVMREVKEETGIDTAFLEVVAFRHAHLVAFEKSDLFFLCMLKPLSFAISIDEKEIQAAKWMPFEEFIGQSFYQEDHMSKKAVEMCLARHENQCRGFTAHRVISKFDDRLSYLYHQDLERKPLE